jgi:hypothetical protein
MSQSTNQPTRSSQRGSVIFGSSAAEELLSRHGLSTVDAVFAGGNLSACRHRGRSVHELRLMSDDGSLTRLFVKLNWGRRRIWPRMTDIKTGQMFQSLPVREWHGLDRFASIGLNVPERLGLFREGLLNFRDAVIVREVPPPYSVDEMLQNGEWDRLTADQHSAILVEMNSIMRTIHTAGIGWRGASSRHFYPQLQADGSWNIWLIDCEGVHRRWSQKIIDRDYNKLYRALKESQASPKILAEFSALMNDITRPSVKEPVARKAA